MSRGGSFYDSADWRRARAKFLATHRVCEAPACSAPSARVDHRIAIKSGGAALDPSNFQAFCERCHNTKTARVDGAFGNAKRPGPAFGGASAEGRPLDPAHHWNQVKRA